MCVPVDRSSPVLTIVRPAPAIWLAQTDSGATDQLEWIDAISAAAIFAIGLALAFAARSVVQRLIEPSNAIIARLAGRVTAGLVATVGLVYALNELGIEVGLILGALGVGGFALAFAMQDILSNLIAGIILQIRQPFSYDDLVAIQGYEGRVSDVNLRAVEMKLLSGETVIIPSSTVLQNPIENWTRRPTRRLSVGVGVDYDADMDAVSEILERAMRSVDDVVTEPDPLVAFDGFGGSSIDFTAMFWFQSDDNFHVVKRRVATAIKRELDAEGIDIPFPIRTLQGPDGGPVGATTGGEAEAERPQ